MVGLNQQMQNQHQVMVKDWMNYMWDHTCLIEKDDPQLESFKMMEELGILSLRIMDKMGAESCAKLVYLINLMTNGCNRWG